MNCKGLLSIIQGFYLLNPIVKQVRVSGPRWVCTVTYTPVRWTAIYATDGTHSHDAYTYCQAAEHSGKTEAVFSLH